SPADVERVFEGLYPDQNVIKELEEALAGLCPQGQLVAVHSSAVEEDGDTHSFAGHLESFLSVSPEQAALKVVEVWKSAFSARAKAYREQRHLPAEVSPPAVIIQRMVDSQVAGVAFGADPVSGRSDLTVISAASGLGAALVNGQCDA